MTTLNLESVEENPPEEGYLEEFRVLQDINERPTVYQQMAYTLKQLIDGEIPSENFDKKRLNHLCKSLIQDQRYDMPEIEGSWAILPREEDDPKIVDAVKTIPSDAWMDLIGRPTYVAQSLLTLVLYEYPEIAEDIEGYEESLQKGYDFSTARAYKGHGFNAVHSMIETMRMFNQTHVLEHISKNPKFSPKVYNTIGWVKAYMEKRLESDNTKGGWNYDFEKDFKRTIEILDNYDLEKNVVEGPTVITSAGETDVV